MIINFRGGHARALLGLNDSARQAEIAEKIIENGMSVRATENLVKTLNNAKPVEIRPSSFDVSQYKSIEKSEKPFRYKGKAQLQKKKGKIEIGILFRRGFGKNIGIDQ